MTDSEREREQEERTGDFLARWAAEEWAAANPEWGASAAAVAAMREAMHEREQETAEPEDSEPHYKVVSSRSQPRVGGRICIEVHDLLTDFVEKWPLEAFVDEDGDFTDETVCKWVNDWNDKAAKAPYARRKCLFCNRKAKIGMTICGHCESAGWYTVVYG